MGLNDNEFEKSLKEYKSILIEKGLKECREEYQRREGNMKFFYEGSIRGFEESRDMDDLKELKKRIEDLRRKEFEMVKKYMEGSE